MSNGIALHVQMWSDILGDSFRDGFENSPKYYYVASVISDNLLSDLY